MPFLKFEDKFLCHFCLFVCLFVRFQSKCEQYWPETTSNYGAITVTLQKTETFADYVIRTLILVKVRQYIINNFLHVLYPHDTTLPLVIFHENATHNFVSLNNLWN